MLESVDQQWRDAAGTFAGRLADTDPKMQATVSRLFNECWGRYGLGWMGVWTSAGWDGCQSEPSACTLHVPPAVPVWVVSPEAQAILPGPSDSVFSPTPTDILGVMEATAVEMAPEVQVIHGQLLDLKRRLQDTAADEAHTLAETLLLQVWGERGLACMCCVGVGTLLLLVWGGGGWSVCVRAYC